MDDHHCTHCGSNRRLTILPNELRVLRRAADYGRVGIHYAPWATMAVLCGYDLLVRHEDWCEITDRGRCVLALAAQTRDADGFSILARTIEDEC